MAINNSALSGRLNRVSGQIEGIKRMVAEQRPVPETLTQLRAVRAAVRSVEADMLEGHLNASAEQVLAEGDSQARAAQLAAIKEIFKRFED